MTDPRTAALAVALDKAFRSQPWPSVNEPDFDRDLAAAILAALPADWCGHDPEWTSAVTHALSDRNEELVREIARYRRIEEAARVAAAEDCQSQALDALRAALEEIAKANTCKQSDRARAALEVKP
jgi:hypothetical protein